MHERQIHMDELRRDRFVAYAECCEHITVTSWTDVSFQSQEVSHPQLWISAVRVIRH